MRKFATIAALSILLSACGFSLRGAHNSTLNLKAGADHAFILTDTSADSYALKHKLSTRLALLGVASDDALLGNQIEIRNLQLRQYELVGVLTEIRLVLSATVTYQLGDRVQTQPVQVERSYQFNEAGVATTDQQGIQARQWLQDALAQRIAEQYYALGLR